MNIFEGDISGTITTGGTAQIISQAKTRSGYFIQNTSSGDLWVSTKATAVQASPSIKISAGSLYETPPNMNPKGDISIIGGTTGQTFTAREW